MNTKILMVCLGNICRSPLAEGIMQAKLNELGVAATVDSAGTGNWHVGEPPHIDSQRVARQHGIDIASQRARQLKAADFEAFDYIFFMDGQNARDGQRIAGNKWHLAKTGLLLEALPHLGITDVPDPYFGGKEDFKLVFDMLTEACTVIAQKLANLEDPLQ